MLRQPQEKPSQETLLVRGARQLITMRGPKEARRGSSMREIGLIADGAVLIGGGRILEVGPTRRVENLAAARNAREINAAGRVVAPGFADCCGDLVHPHPALDAYDAAAAYTGSTAPVAVQDPLSGLSEIRGAPARRLELRAQSLVLGMARHGTTTVGAKSGWGLDHSGELKILRVLKHLNHRPLRVVSTFYGARARPPEFTDDSGYLEWICAKVLPGIARRKLAATVEINCGAAGFPTAPRAYLECARRLGFRLSVSAGSSAEAVNMAISAGADSVSIESASREAAAALARSEAVSVIAPVLSCQQPFADARFPRALVDAGSAVALATGPASPRSATYNMQMAMSLACSRMGLAPAEAFCAATVNAAAALGVLDETGILEPGMRADLVLLNAQDYREIPHFAGVNHTHLVLKDGAVIFREGGGEHWPAV